MSELKLHELSTEELLKDERVKEILRVCKGNTEYMWAAKIVGIIFECDFRDAGLKLSKALAEWEREC